MATPDRWRRWWAGTSPRVMGVVKATDDSLWEGSRFPDPAAAAAAAAAMVRAGAAWIDVGGASSRPGAEAVAPETELARLLPLLRAVRAAVDVPVSVDTGDAGVVRAAVAAGADAVNAGGGLDGPGMLAALGECRVPVVLVATRPVPPEAGVLAAVAAELEGAAARLRAVGLPRNMLLADPGFGFGKTVEENLRLISGVPWLRARLDMPVCIGPSRRRTTGRRLGGQPLEGRPAGTLALVALSAAYGADLVRVHDVEAAVDAARVASACGVPRPPAAPGTITLRGLELSGRHGVLQEERVDAQPFIIDLELVVDLAPAARSDRLEDTVDYGRAAQVAAAVVDGPHHDLVESIAGDIARALVREFPGLSGGAVTVHKPAAPVGLSCADVLVRLPFDAAGNPVPD